MLYLRSYGIVHRFEIFGQSVSIVPSSVILVIVLFVVVVVFTLPN